MYQHRSLLVLTCFLTAILASLGYLSFYGALNGDAFTTDSINYYSRSLLYCASYFDPIVSSVLSGDFVSLNWKAVTSFGGFLCSIASENYFPILAVQNVMLVSVTFFLYLLAFKSEAVGEYRFRLFGLFFCSNLFLIPSMSSLNKEVVSFFLCGLLYLFYIRGSLVGLLIVSFCSLFIKVQFFCIGALLMASVVGVRFTYILVFISLVVSAVYFFVNPAYLDAAHYYARYTQNISSAGIMSLVSEISRYPLGYVVSFPMKVAINFGSGAFLFPGLLSGRPLAVLYYLNSFFLFLLFCASVVRLVYSRWELGSKPVQFFLIFCVVIAVLPFVQPRYYFPLLPVMVVYCLSSPFDQILSSRRLCGVVGRSVSKSSENRTFIYE